MLVSGILIIILLICAALTAASEISIIAVSRIRIRRLVSQGSKSARIIMKMLETPEKFFSTILVVNNIVDTLIAAIVTAIMISLIGENRGIIAATIIGSLLIIVFEVVAKTLAATHSEKLSLILAKPVNYMIIVFSPVVKGLVYVVNFILRLVSTQAPAKPALVTEDELKSIIKIRAEEDSLQKEKYKMLSKVFDFSDTIVKNVMTPKKEVVFINMNSPLDDIMEKVLESGYSRLPVYKDSPENIIGIINMKDLLNLALNKELVVLNDIIYPATVFPETKKVSELLKEFQKGHTHIGIVVDAKGKPTGIVTIEDLLEEIVGEIEDEYDIRASYYKNPQ
ncbi:MAG: hemolysin family protein [Candidatus Omnitrophica bacterium]|nr:hemolysin family protein [Candidatus Omnitrophota bacterium]MDD5436910.1 hemolysin family protein [Candidatus Omnitrophota bacterium]